MGAYWTPRHSVPDSKVHVAHMGPTWVLSAPSGPHVGPMNLAIRGGFLEASDNQAVCRIISEHLYTWLVLYCFIVLCDGWFYPCPSIVIRLPQCKWSKPGEYGHLFNPSPPGSDNITSDKNYVFPLKVLPPRRRYWLTGHQGKRGTTQPLRKYTEVIMK